MVSSALKENKAGRTYTEWRGQVPEPVTEESHAEKGAVCVLAASVSKRIFGETTAAKADVTHRLGGHMVSPMPVSNFRAVSLERTGPQGAGA